MDDFSVSLFKQSEVGPRIVDAPDSHNLTVCSLTSTKCNLQSHKRAFNLNFVCFNQVALHKMVVFLHFPLIKPCLPREN